MNTLKIAVNGKKFQVEGVYVNRKQWAVNVYLADGLKMFSMEGPGHTVSGKKWTLKPTVKKNVALFTRIGDDVLNPETARWFRRTKFVTSKKVKAGKKVTARALRQAEELAETMDLQKLAVAFRNKLASRNYESFVTSMNNIIQELDDMIVDMR